MKININGTWKTIVKGLININGTWRSISKGLININGFWKSIWSAGGPTQISRPTLSGSGQSLTNITRSSGTYTNYTSITTTIFSTTDDTPLVDGLTIAATGTLTSSNPYEITQADATPPAYIYYARDAVLGIDGTTTYYYYSLPKQSYIANVYDNFNRTSGSTLGTMSSGYIYSSYSQGTSWSTNGSYAVNSGSAYELKTIDIGKTDVSLNVSIPDGGGSMGLSFWVTSGGSWWGVYPRYSYSQESVVDYQCDTGYTYVPQGSDCPPLATTGTNPQAGGYNINDLGLRCSDCYEQTTTETTYPCTGVGTTRGACPDTGPNDGDRCGACYQGDAYSDCSGYVSAQTSCPDTGTLEGQRCGNCEPYIVESYPCTEYRTGTCPGSPSGNVAGDQCTNCQTQTDTYDVCDVYVTGQANCDGKCNSTCISTVNTSNQCTGNSSGSSCPGTGPNAGDRCGACTSSTTTTYPCNTYVTGRTYTGGTGTNLGDRCSSATSSTNTTYPCTGSSYGSTCPDTGPNAGDRCGACTSVAQGPCKSSGGCPYSPVIYTGCFGGTYRCAAYYTYSVRNTSTSTVYSYYTIGQVDTTTYSYPVRVETTSTTYSYYVTRRVTTSYSSWYIRGTAQTTRYNYFVNETKYELNYPKRVTQISTITSKYYKKVSEVNTTQYTYSSNLKINSSSGSGSEATVSTYITTGSSYDPTLFNKIYGISVNTSGNSITAKAYSDTGISSQMGSNVVYSASGATKGTSVGLIKGTSTENEGSYLDNFEAS